MSASQYEQICGYKTNFEHLVDEITYFYQQSRGKCRLMIKTVNLSVDSEEEKECFYKIFSPICDEISIENVIDACEAVDYKKIMSESALEKTKYGTKLEEKICCDTLFMNINIHSNGDVDTCDSFDEKIKFDKKMVAISTFQTLEHMENLRETVQCMYNILEKNGVGIINVPNGEQIIKKQLISSNIIRTY